MITLIDCGVITLSSGTYTVASSDLLSSDSITVTNTGINVVDTIAHSFTYVISNIVENTSFDIKSVLHSTDGTLDMDDNSKVSYLITRKS